MRLLSRVLCLVAVLALGGCAATTELVRTVNQAAPEAPARSLIVVGVTPDDALRRRYEEAFLAVLADAGIPGIGSHTLIPTLGGLTMPDIRQHMTAGSDRADAVIHVQLVNLVPAAALLPDDVPADAAPATREVGGVQLTLNAPPSGPARAAPVAVELEANLYSLPDRKLRWTAITRTNEANDVARVARSHARLMVDEMVRRGLLAAPR